MSLDNHQCGAVVRSGRPGWRQSSGPPASGGEHRVLAVPCWDPVEELDERRRAAERRDPPRVGDAQRAAAGLARAELAACRGLSPAEIEHSPFAHRTAIAEVIPHREGGAVRGVRIVFRPVPGLTLAWMQQAIACHRARFAQLGGPPTYLPEDPTLVAGTTTTASVRRGRLEVLVEARDDVAARVALDRAEDLVRPRTANR